MKSTHVQNLVVEQFKKLCQELLVVRAGERGGGRCRGGLPGRGGGASAATESLQKHFYVKRASPYTRSPPYSSAP